MEAAVAASYDTTGCWRDQPVQFLVRDNNVDQALRALKKKMQREGVFREMKLRRNYEKPSERRAREKAEAVLRYRKLLLLFFLQSFATLLFDRAVRAVLTGTTGPP